MTDLNRKPVGPLSLSQSARERDARIPEKNDGPSVVESEWVKKAAASKDEVFAGQSRFFDKLKNLGG